MSGNPHWGGGPEACYLAAQRCAQRALIARMAAKKAVTAFWELRAEYWQARAQIAAERRTFAPARWPRPNIEASARIPAAKALGWPPAG